MWTTTLCGLGEQIEGPVSSIDDFKQKEKKTKVAMKRRDGSTRLDVTRHLRLRAVSFGPRFNLIEQKDALHFV